MAYTKALYEIVDEVRKSKNVKIKADILQQNESTALIDLLQLTLLLGSAYYKRLPAKLC